MTEADEDAWCEERRAEVAEYLAQQEDLVHGRIGDWPAWHFAPYVSMWAVESVTMPGMVGWWAICGDVPTDCCSAASECAHPRAAMKQMAQGWIEAVMNTEQGAPTIAGTRLSANLAPKLAGKASLLLKMAADDELWAE